MTEPESIQPDQPKPQILCQILREPDGQVTVMTHLPTPVDVLKALTAGMDAVVDSIKKSAEVIDRRIVQPPPGGVSRLRQFLNGNGRRHK